MLNTRALIIGFVIIHVVFLAALLPTIITGNTLGDLPLYRWWAEQALNNNHWQGIDVPWVYPAGALIPIVGAQLLGSHLYLALWFVMTTVLNGVGVLALTNKGHNKEGFTAAWWFLLLNVLLSPVALLRLEGITSPIVVLGLIILARRPVVASLVLTLATWIKVWPAAVMLAVVTAAKKRIAIIAAGAALSGLISIIVILAGGAANLTSFATMQTDRALQLEAPITTPWVWLYSLGVPQIRSYFNHEISTREVSGPGTELVSALMNPIMFAAIGAILVLMLLALRKQSDRTPLILVGALGMVTAFFVFNKVGSPQYVLWVTPVIAVGLVYSVQFWRFPAIITAVIALLTTLIFPIFYMPLVAGEFYAVTLLTVRNVLLVVLLVWPIVKLCTMIRAPHPVSPTPKDPQSI
ncbi:hypothetical protein [Lysinibacter sp. HNR]|uniref:hypothetical protein n=1 Tax=Lysinibacter sp. HNR TaxID=3031408 RepID=UPI0024354835|nr:hypothetical protein [Lysinibacter sp. HNR]WGD37720.1 hypothetical protein FrondiHNR_02055 [Lysinibacter sp. HNR]